MRSTISRPSCRRMAASWTAGAVFPGGDMRLLRMSLRISKAKSRSSARRSRSGSRAPMGRAPSAFVKHAHAMADLGRDFGGGLTEAEVRYLIENEWARKADDVLWRRSKLGLHLTAGSAARFARPHGRLMRPRCERGEAIQGTMGFGLPASLRLLECRLSSAPLRRVRHRRGAFRHHAREPRRRDGDVLREEMR